MTENPAPKRLCVGVVTGPHGIRGAVRLKSFTANPEDIGAYGPLSDGTGTRRFDLRVTGRVKDALIAEIAGIRDRNGAEALKGLQLHVDRDRLPPPEDDEFYHADLIGLRAELGNGDFLGHVTGLHDFGAGQSIEIAAVAGETLMVPFTKAAVPVIEIAAGRLVVDPPAGLLEKPEPPVSLAEQQRAALEVAP
jgi:16S rRNA processing protein RimM